jgi:hypothetical protein
MKNVIIDFSKLGGYRLKQATLDKMQESYIFYLKTLVSFLGCAETGSYIISGCQIVGANITAGMMYIDGELCPFAGTPGDANTLIAKQATTSTLNFKNGVDQPVFRELEAVKVSSGGTMWIDFIKFHYVNDSNYIHTEENFTAALLAKLNAIEAGAEVNVQSDWNVTNPLSDAYIKNKPVIENVLKTGSAILGAVGSNTTTVINFPDVGTTNYHVICEVESLSPFGSRSQDVVSFATAAYTATSFDFMLLAMINTGVRNIKLHYKLIAN